MHIPTLPHTHPLRLSSTTSPPLSTTMPHPSSPSIISLLSSSHPSITPKNHPTTTSHLYPTGISHTYTSQYYTLAIANQPQHTNTPQSLPRNYLITIVGNNPPHNHYLTTTPQLYRTISTTLSLPDRYNRTSYHTATTIAKHIIRSSPQPSKVHMTVGRLYVDIGNA